VDKREEMKKVLMSNGEYDNDIPTEFCDAIDYFVGREQEFMALLRELFNILDTKEESDGGRIFNPTTINTCRVIHSAKLKELLPKLRELVNTSNEEEEG